MRVLRRLMYAAISMVALGAVTYVELHAASGGLKEWQLIALASVVALFGPGQIAYRALAEWFGEVAYETRLAMEEPAKACVVGITKITSIPFTDVGVTVFIVLKSRDHPIRGIQKRQVRVRMESNPAPTTVRWTKDKGLLGECWRERRDASRDHSQFFDGYMNCSETDWEKVPDKIRQGLTYGDYQQIRMFEFVLATPMIDPSNGAYRGCLVIQVPTKLRDELIQPEVIELIHSSAALTCAVLK